MAVGSDDSETKSCFDYVKVSFKAISSVYTDSNFILSHLKQDPYSTQFKYPIKRLVALRLIWLLLIIGVELCASYPQKWLMNALQHQSYPQFFHSLKYLTLALIIIAPIHTIDSYLGDLLAVRLREALCKILINRYHQNSNFYHIASNDNIDNPGQRIDEDTQNWIYGIVTFLTIIFREAVTLTVWLFLIISKNASIVVWGFLASIIIVLASVVIFAGRLTAIAFSLAMHSADFRGGIIRTRDHGETIAFYQASDFESYWSMKRLDKIVIDLIMQARWQSGLHCLNETSRYFLQMLPMVLLFKSYVDGKYELGDLTQIRTAFIRMVSALTILVSQMNRLANIQAAGSRVAGVLTEIDKVDENVTNPPVIRGSGVFVTPRSAPNGLGGKKTLVTPNNAGIIATNYDGVMYEYLADTDIDEESVLLESSKVLVTHNLSIIVPNTKSLLLYKLNMTVVRHQNLLIVGPSGSGKSSLLRVLSGLWKWGGGTVKRLDDSQVMFLPQRPYLPILNEDENTLKNQLLFPKFAIDKEEKDQKKRITVKIFSELLDKLNLAYILDYESVASSGSQDWSKTLSLGEQQRLSFGRVSVANPKMVFLDEATSALDVDNQRAMYQLLQQQNITYLSVGHRLNLIEFHDAVLEIIGDGSWKIWTKENYLEHIKEELTMDNQL